MSQLHRVILTQPSIAVNHMTYPHDANGQSSADRALRCFAFRLTRHCTEQDNVTGVNVSISKGYRDFNGRTYLFLWTGTEWADASPDAVSVTVTSSVP